MQDDVMTVIDYVVLRWVIAEDLTLSGLRAAMRDSGCGWSAQRVALGRLWSNWLISMDDDDNIRATDKGREVAVLATRFIHSICAHRNGQATPSQDTASVFAGLVAAINAGSKGDD